MTRIFAAALVTSLFGGTALAQVADEPAAPVPSESVPSVPSASVPSAPMEADPVVTQTDPETQKASPIHDEARATEGPTGLKISMFADAYYNYSSTKNTTSAGAASPQPGHRAYSASNGFGLSFLGTDIVYDTEHFGATASLRFGPSVPIFYGRGALYEANDSLGIGNILQAYATWKPTDTLAIDFGQFGTIYGAEVAESWKNLNYTRGGLYYAMQPFWHTGVRAKLAVSDQLTLTGMIVNGVNNAVDSGAETPSLGVQAGYVGEGYGVVVGYLGSTNPETDEYFDHFVDVLVTATIGDLNLVLNADFGMDTKRIDSVDTGGEAMFYGISVAAGLKLTEDFGVALRGEYLDDPDGRIWGAPNGSNLITGTLTFDYRPGHTTHLILRWDNRVEKASETIFSDRGGKTDDLWYQSVVGVVVTTD